MLYFISLLGLACTGIVMSHFNEKLRFCLKDERETELDNFLEMQEPLESVCPVVFRVKDCVDNLMEEQDATIAEIAASQPETYASKASKISANLISILIDVCTDGTDLNEGYKASIGCRKSLDMEDSNCLQKTFDAVHAYLDIMKAVDEGGDEEDTEDQRKRKNCLYVAYMSACTASFIHDKCGEDAFNFYRTIAKRSSIIQTNFCTEEALVEVKNGFLESLIHEEQHHQDLFKLVLDLRRRK